MTPWYWLENSPARASIELYIAARDLLSVQPRSSTQQTSEASILAPATGAFGGLIFDIKNQRPPKPTTTIPDSIVVVGGYGLQRMLFKAIAATDGFALFRLLPVI